MLYTFDWKDRMIRKYPSDDREITLHELVKACKEIVFIMRDIEPLASFVKIINESGSVYYSFSGIMAELLIQNGYNLSLVNSENSVYRAAIGKYTYDGVDLIKQLDNVEFGELIFSDPRQSRIRNLQDLLLQVQYRVVTIGRNNNIPLSDDYYQLYFENLLNWIQLNGLGDTIITLSKERV